eukprot:176776_1
MITTLLLCLSVLVTFYCIIIIIAIFKDKHENDKKREHNNNNILNVKSKWKSFKTRYAITLTSVLSLFAAYDLFGDTYFLYTFDSIPYSAQVTIDTGTHGIAFCASELPSLCAPLSEQPEIILSDYNWSNDNNPWKQYDDQLNPLQVTINGGYSCNELLHDHTLYGTDNQLLSKYQKCLNIACNNCQNQCIYDDDAGSYTNLSVSDWSRTRPIINSIYDQGSSSRSTFLNCMDIDMESGPIGFMPAFILLGFILFKEVMKMVFVLAYFFSTTAQKSTLIKIAINSPLTGIFVVMSERFKTDVLNIKNDAKTRRTLGLILDLLFEDIPQLILPFWMVVDVRSNTPSIVSISGSLIMVIINSGLLVSNLCKDYKETLDVKKDTNESDITKIKEQTNTEICTQIHINTQTVNNVNHTNESNESNEEFKTWFYEHIDLKEFTEQYF